MELDGVRKVENAEFYVDLAFRKATQVSDNMRGSKLIGTRVEKSRKIEIAKIEAVSESLNKNIFEIIRSFPDLDSLTEFYKQLFKISLDVRQLKRSLGGINWLHGKVSSISKEYSKKIRSTEQLEIINQHRREFYGRISSFVKQVKTDFAYLEKCRHIMKEFPSVKSMFTVCIAGFPNVGKSTLLSKLTTAKPEIKDYAFTTKKLNIGYLKEDYLSIQFIDTPGTLNRFDKMNNIEKQADIAMEFCSQIIIYVIDPTESYPLHDQVKLLGKIKLLKKTILIYVSKTDIATAEQVKLCTDLNKKIPIITSIEELRSTVIDLARKQL